MRAEQYIKELGTDLDCLAFFSHFGYKDRANGEEELKKAIIKVHETTKDMTLKAFLNEEFIENEFKALSDNFIIDDYWTNIQELTIADLQKKRKIDTILSATKSSVKRTVTKRDIKSTKTVNKNNIKDYSNEGITSQKSVVEGFENQVEEFDTNAIVPELHKKTVDAINKIMDPEKERTPFTRYLKSLSYIQQYPESYAYIYKIISHVMEQHDINPEIFDLTNMSTISEGTLNMKIWSRIIDILFSKTDIVIKSGDTVLRDDDNDFKVDYRLGVVVNGIFVDISTIEVAKLPEYTKTRDDHNKLLLEAKLIINGIITKYNFLNPAQFTIPTLQICGLKADLVSTCLSSKKTYVASRLCPRLRLPLSPIDINEMKEFIRHVVLFRKDVLKTASLIKTEINKAIDRRVSFSKVLGPSYNSNLPSYADWITPVNRD